MPILQYKSEMSIVCECVYVTVKIQINNNCKYSTHPRFVTMVPRVFGPPIEKNSESAPDPFEQGPL